MNVRDRILENYTELKKSSRIIADAVLENPKILLNKNAKEILTKHMINNKSINFKYLEAIKYLKTLLSIETLDRIECYDISNISGDFNVGSMVVYKNGYKSKKDYRKFKINTVKGKMIIQVIEKCLQEDLIGF